MGTTTVATRRQERNILRNKTWRVLDTDGEIYEVYPENMSFGHDEKGARQLTFVNSVIEYHRTSNYIAISALHKEIRRGDYARAYLWALTVIRFRQEKGLKDYMRSILWEETRNIVLYQEWRSNPGMPWQKMLEQFCGSTKKYEINGSKNTFQIQIQAINDAAELPTIQDGELLHPPTVDRFEFYNWMLLIQRSFERAFREGGGKIKDTRSPRMRCYRILSGTLRRSLAAEGLKPWSEPFDGRTDFDDVMQTSEKLCGLLESDDVCSVRDIDTSLFEADIAMPEPRVFDGHTSKGYGLLRRWSECLDPLAENGLKKPMPSYMDMRWSGHQIGVWWRYRAFETFGLSYKNVDWEDLSPHVSAADWKAVLRADDHWFHYLP